MRGRHRQKAIRRDEQRTAAQIEALQARLEQEKARRRELEPQLAELDSLQDEVTALSEQLRELMAPALAAAGADIAELRELLELAKTDTKRLQGQNGRMYERHLPKNGRVNFFEEAVAKLDEESDMKPLMIDGVHVNPKKRKLTTEQIVAIQRARGIRR